jgi:hypothetical protein
VNDADFNPYSPPKSDLEPATATSVESVRRKFLKYEASILEISGVLYVAALACVAYGLATLSLGGSKFIAAGVLSGVTGGLLQNFSTLGRIGALCGAGLIIGNPPVGTIIALYALFVLLNPAAGIIFSEDYRKILSATEAITPERSSAIRLIFAVLLLVSLGVYAMIKVAAF